MESDRPIRPLTKSRGKFKVLALLAVEHKLLCHAFAILRNKTTYDITHHPLKTSESFFSPIDPRRYLIAAMPPASDPSI
jgi:hypothetical protein